MLVTDIIVTSHSSSHLFYFMKFITSIFFFAAVDDNWLFILCGRKNQNSCSSSFQI